MELGNGGGLKQITALRRTFQTIITISRVVRRWKPNTSFPPKTISTTVKMCFKRRPCSRCSWLSGVQRLVVVGSARQCCSYLLGSPLETILSVTSSQRNEAPSINGPALTRMLDRERKKRASYSMSSAPCRSNGHRHPSLHIKSARTCSVGRRS